MTKLLRWVTAGASVALLAFASAFAGARQTKNSDGSNPGKFQFEVASIKPSNPSGKGGFVDTPGPGHLQQTFEAKNYPLMGVIRMAFGLPFGSDDGRLIGAPGWLGSARYDIEAKMDDATLEALNKLGLADRQAALKAMLQALLADRCQLKAHSETREMSVYYLVIAKGGAKLQESNPQDYTSGVAASGRREGLGLRGRGGPLEGGNAPIDALAGVLSTLLSRQVIDKTGLTGKYDFTLQWAPDEGEGRFLKDSAAPPPDQPAGVDSNFPSLFGALEKELGLRLEAAKGPVEVIVIDHMEKPSAN